MLLRRTLALRAQTTPGAWSSKYGPTMKSRLHLGGMPIAPLTRYAPMAAALGVTAGIALLFLGEEIPTVRQDIFQSLPIIGRYWDRSVPPEDNPF